MASGALLSRFGAAANMPPAAAYATPDVRNALLVLDFDAVTDESAFFVDVLPPTYGGGGLTIKLRWMASTATSGDVAWAIQIERHQRGVDDSDADSFAGMKWVAGTAITPSGTEIQTTLTFANGAEMDNLAVGERYRLKVFRNASNGADTMSGDAELVTVDVLET